MLAHGGRVCVHVWGVCGATWQRAFAQDEVLEVGGVVDGHQLHGFLQVLSLNASQRVAGQRQHHLPQRDQICLLS